MVGLESPQSASNSPCLRTYGRAECALRAYLESSRSRTPCWVRDLSLGGARIETDQELAPDQSIWLSFRKLKIFATVKWVRGSLVGIQFEEKLPKSLVLSLRGEVVDPETLAEMEAILAAQNWVVGTPIDRPKSARLADVLGAGGRRPAQPLAGGAPAPRGFKPEKSPPDPSGKRRAAVVIALSVAVGVLLGLGSIFII